MNFVYKVVTLLVTDSGANFVYVRNFVFNYSLVVLVNVLLISAKQP